MFHKHKWKEVKRVFTQPDSAVESIRGVGTITMERTIYGFTNIELQCERCHDIKFVQVLGDQRK